MARPKVAEMRAARNREIADWLDGWVAKAKGRRSAEICTTVEALAGSIRAGLAE